jgi:hypothetical protein
MGLEPATSDVTGIRPTTEWLAHAARREAVAQLHLDRAPVGKERELRRMHNVPMMGRTFSLLASILVIASMPAVAQWLDYPTPGIPRLSNGKPNLSAPAPRRPDGRADLSGIWKADPQYRKYLLDLAVDFKPGEFPIQPWAEALTKQRTKDNAHDQPSTFCLPLGVPELDTGTAMFPLKIVQEPGLVVILHEEFGYYRQIFLDGRPLPADPNPSWFGYSVGHWDGDTLVVDTTGFNGKFWLDVAGHPATDALHLTERFRRRDFGNLDLQMTIDDPKAYTKPFTVALTIQFDADTELLEYVCNENEKDAKHIK